MLKGRQNYLCRRRVEAFAQRPGPARRARGRGRVRAAAAVDRLDRRRATAPSSTSEPPRFALGRARRRPRPLPRPALPARDDLLRRARAAARGPGRARDRQPRALLRRPRAARGRPTARACCPSTTPSSSTRRTSSRSRAATWLGARITAGAVRRLVADAAQAAAEAGVRAAPRADRRPGRARGGGAPARGRAAERAPPRPASCPREQAPRADRRSSSGSRRRALGRAATSSTPSPIRARKLARDVAACLETDRPERVVWAEPGAARVRAGRRLRAPARLALVRGPDGDPRVRDARVRLRPAPPRASSDADRFDAGSPFDFRSQALLYVPRRVARAARGVGGGARSRRSAGSRAGGRSS